MEPSFNPYDNSQNNNPNNNPNNGYLYEQFPYNRPPMYEKPNHMETAAFTLGVLSIVTCSCIYGAYIFGAIAIVLALLSRGGKMKLSSKAKLGILLAVIGIVITTVFYVYAFYIAIQEYGSFEALLRESCEMMGYDFDTLFGDMFAQ